MGLARSYGREGLLYPRRDFRGRWSGPVYWKPLSVRDATRILHNPFYAGAYFYGERRAVTSVDPATRTRKTVLQHLPRERWKVLIQASHPAYLSWEQFLVNQERLRDNRFVTGTERGAAAVEGVSPALEGILSPGDVWRNGRKSASSPRGTWRSICPRC